MRQDMPDQACWQYMPDPAYLQIMRQEASNATLAPSVRSGPSLARSSEPLPPSYFLRASQYIGIPTAMIAMRPAPRRRTSARRGANVRLYPNDTESAFGFRPKWPLTNVSNRILYPGVHRSPNRSVRDLARQPARSSCASSYCCPPAYCRSGKPRRLEGGWR